MYEWHKQIQSIVDEIDNCIKSRDDEALTLGALSERLGYSEFYTTRKFREIAGMPLREYLSQSSQGKAWGIPAVRLINWSQYRTLIQSCQFLI